MITTSLDFGVSASIDSLGTPPSAMTPTSVGAGRKSDFKTQNHQSQQDCSPCQ
ncbi:hypothetical protein RvY_11541 [Ramazzottius varieornatus]|uniref:Uncharacterized protein n=1 Tax=Ramazzottius varieornatus TaxID=947166 RepID=A0A1D1VGF8_RAMVA|nr:hypothetical protein RvY_11541 [Ramazzottius varieornatus]